MKDFLKYLVSLIVVYEKEVEIEEIPLAETSFQYRIKTHADDIGKVIGKQGKIIQAIRNIAKIRAIKENKQIRIEIG